MPVMKQLRIGSATYDTVGEASVTQVQTSGTKIATVTIDGTATDLYAPEGGGGGPEPSSTTPSMDGTAAVGTATTYARADHVHPTDTSRQETLVSGTNIKTVNGTSILGSGDITTPTYTLPTASTSMLGGVKVDGSTITITDGVISSSGGGGGGFDLVVRVTIDDNDAVISHDANAAACIAFAKDACSGQATTACAICTLLSYDDEDDIYYSNHHVLPLINISTTSYGGGYEEVDGGWSFTFAQLDSDLTKAGAQAFASFVTRRLTISGVNDDTEISPTVTFVRRSTTLN